MNRSNFFRCVVLVTAFFVGVAQGAASTPETFTTDLFTKLKQENFKVETTQPFATLTNSDKKMVAYFFNELVTKLGNTYQGSLTAWLGSWFTWENPNRTDLTWQQVKNIITMLNNQQTTEHIIKIFGKDQAITIKDKKYPFALFLNSLKRTFEEEYLKANEQPTYRIADYVPKEILEIFSNNTWEKKEQLNIMQSLLEDLKKDLASLEQEKIATIEKLESISNEEKEAEKKLAEIKANGVPSAGAVTPLDQLKIALMALKTKLAYLAQVLNHLQNPGAPLPVVPSNINHQKMIEETEATIKEKQEESSNAQVKINEITQKVDEYKQEIDTINSKIKDFEEIKYATPIPAEPVANDITNKAQHTIQEMQNIANTESATENMKELFKQAEKKLQALRQAQNTTDQEKINKEILSLHNQISVAFYEYYGPQSMHTIESITQKYPNNDSLKKIQREATGISEQLKKASDLEAKRNLYIALLNILEDATAIEKKNQEESWAGESLSVAIKNANKMIANMKTIKHKAHTYKITKPGIKNATCHNTISSKLSIAEEHQKVLDGTKPGNKNQAYNYIVQLYDEITKAYTQLWGAAELPPLNLDPLPTQP